MSDFIFVGVFCGEGELWGRKTFCKKFYFTFAAKYNYIVIQISCVVVKLFMVGARRVPHTPTLQKLKGSG